MTNPTKNMQYSFTTIYVSDIAAAADFYLRAFGVEPRFTDPSGAYTQLETGATALGFASIASAYEHGFRDEGEITAHAARGVVVGLTCDDAKAAVKKALAAGAVLVAPAERKPWGPEVGYVRDPFGCLIELVCMNPTTDTPWVRGSL